MKKKICFITALLLLVATISSALAVETKNSSGSHYNATYEITSIGSSCKLLAKATLTVARTATYNIGNSSYANDSTLAESITYTAYQY